MSADHHRLIRKPKPLSSAIDTDLFVFVSGQGGIVPETGEIVGPDLESQTIQTLNNIIRILSKAGLSMNDVVKCTVYLKHRGLYEEFNDVYERIIQEPYPSRTVVYCDLNYDLLVEIDAIAIKGEKRAVR